MRLREFNKKREEKKNENKIWKAIVIFVGSFALIFLIISFFQSFAVYKVRSELLMINAKVVIPKSTLETYCKTNPCPVGCSTNPNSLACTVFYDNVLAGTYFINVPDYSIVPTNEQSGLYATSSNAYPSLTETSAGLFKSTHDNSNQPNYYFRGNGVKNVIKFGKNKTNQDLYWKIIRINGDGSIRIIYNGTAETGLNSQYGSSYFNAQYQHRYIGFMYGTESSSYYSTHTNTYPSTILGVLNAFWDDTFTSKNSYGGISMASKIETNQIFCGDRNKRSTDVGCGYNSTVYGASTRIVYNKYPSLQCNNKSGIGASNDQFSAGGGNVRLSYPIGLINADEVVMAGGISNNTNYWLYTNSRYWTMSPSGTVVYGEEDGPEYMSVFALVFSVADSGGISESYTDSLLGVRPVVNLRSNTIFDFGEGTWSNPYVIN